MASTKTSNAVEARRRAREAKAVLDAQRADHDKLVEEATTNYYVATATVEDLEAEIVEARANAERAVVELLGLGESADRVSVLTGLDIKDVRRIKREAAEAGNVSGGASGDGPDAGAENASGANQS
jgi:hypothetical protein